MKSSLISKNNLFTHTHTNSENLLPQSNLVFNEKQKHISTETSK